MKEIILPKNMFGCLLKLILGFFGIIYVFGYKPKYWYTIMCECENPPPYVTTSYGHAHHGF
jgi:hypothetical protein